MSELSPEERSRSNSSMYYYAGYNSGLNRGRVEGRDEREREILAQLADRVSDLESCGKNDDCAAMARIVQVCIDDITYREDEENDNGQL